MTMIRLLPPTEVDRFARDPFFRGLWDMFDDRNVAPNTAAWYPAMHVEDAEDRLIVNVDLPGMDPKDVQINLQNDVLTIEGERKYEKETETKTKALVREQVYGKFARTFELPYRVQVDKVKAQANNGVLTIVLPKAEEHLGRQIQIEVK
jgi:HSP20 family protein